MSDRKWMQLALTLAQQAQQHEEIPVGAVVVRDNQCLGLGYNQVRTQCDALAHAEMIALRQAMNKIGYERLPDATLYVTLEPCMMCMGALLQARIKRLVFGTRDYRAGAAGSIINVANGFKAYATIQVDEGIMQSASAALLKQFFQTHVRAIT